MILLDTHAVIWLLLEPERISAAARKAIELSVRDSNAPGISSVSFYEVARALHRGRVQSPLTPDAFLERLQSYVRAIHPTAAIAVAAAQLPSSFPSDPMDRIIAATALIEGVPLVTADEHIRGAGVVKTIW